MMLGLPLTPTTQQIQEQAVEKIAVNTSDVSTGKSTGEKVHLPLRCFLPLSGVNHGVGLIHLEEAQKKQWSLQIICSAN